MTSMRIGIVGVAGETGKSIVKALLDAEDIVSHASVAIFLRLWLIISRERRCPRPTLIFGEACLQSFGGTWC